MYPYIQNGVPNYGLGANQGSPLYYQSESPHPEGHPLYKKEGYYTLGRGGVRKYVSGPTNTKNGDVDQKAPDLSTAHLTGGSSTYVPGQALPRFPGVYGGPLISTNPFGSVPQVPQNPMSSAAGGKSPLSMGGPPMLNGNVLSGTPPAPQPPASAGKAGRLGALTSNAVNGSLNMAANVINGNYPRTGPTAPPEVAPPEVIAGNQPMIYPWIPRGIPKLEETVNG